MKQQVLLLFLAQQDRGLPRAKCDDSAVAQLMTHGLVKERPARICLTAMGWAEVARIQERMRSNETEVDDG